jgi:hypothetical protein
MSGHLDVFWPVDGGEEPELGVTLTPVIAIDNELVMGGEAYAIADVFFSPNGELYYTDGVLGYNFRPGEWFNPETAGIGLDYEIFATHVSGDVPVGSPLDTWLTLGEADVGWSLFATQSEPGATSSEGVIAVSIRRAIDSVVEVADVEVQIQAFAEFA